MHKKQMVEDLRDLDKKIKAWDREDIYKMYEWLIQVNSIARALNDDALFVSIIQPHNLPVGSSPAPKNLHNVWSWDNHGRYLVGSRWTEEKLKIRRLDELAAEQYS